MIDHYKPRIIVSGPLPPPLGGMESYCNDYLKTDISAHFDIIFCPCLLMKQVAEKTGIFGLLLRCVNRILTLLIWLYKLTVKRPQIAHVHTNSGAGFFARGWMTLWAERFGVRSVLHMHGASFKEFYSNLNPGRKKKALKLLQANTFLIVLSEAWKIFFISIGVPEEKIVVMENSVFVPDLKDNKQNRNGKLTALYLSRIEKRKGVFELIDAIDANRNLFDDYRFIIAGPLSHDHAVIKEHIESLGLSDSIEMPGPLIGAAKDAAYRQADVYLLQSYAEGMPIGLLEAMSYGLVCISTPVGGIPDVIQHDVNGLLIPPGDSAALAAALHTMVKGSSMRKSLGHHARETIEQKYSWDNRSVQLMNLYNVMLHK